MFNIIPHPKFMELTGGQLTLEQGQLERIQRYTMDDDLPEICQHKIVTSKQNSQSYKMEITINSIIIISATKIGLFYAVQTLKQIVNQSEGLHLPCVKLEDVPDFDSRAVLLDVSRDKVPTMNTLRDFVDKISEWKYNELQLYMEHTFAYTQHRQIWQNASPFTAQEIKEIKEYSRVRGITLVPNQNSFGHMERWLCHNDYKYLAESPDGFTDPWGVFRCHSSTLAPTAPKTTLFLEGLYDEFLPCFDSEYLNIGGDEPWELGMGYSKELCEQKGLERVYLDFLLKIHDIVGKRGYKIQIYADIIMKYPHLIKELPQDIMLVNWGYEANHPFEKECRQIAEAKTPFYVCTGTSSWNSIGGRWQNTYENISNAIKSADEYEAKGFMIAEWGDNGHWQQYPIAFLGLIFGATAAWNDQSIEAFNPVQTMAVHLFQGDYAVSQAAFNLQNVWQQSKIILHNVSLPAILLLDPIFPYYRQDYKKFRHYSFQKELNLIEEAEYLLTKKFSQCDALFKEELLFSANLLGHACKLGQLQMNTGNLCINEIDPDSRKNLSVTLDFLMERYKTLWNLRNRLGGLDESIGRMIKLREAYR